MGEQPPSYYLFFFARVFLPPPFVVLGRWGRVVLMEGVCFFHIVFFLFSTFPGQFSLFSLPPDNIAGDQGLRVPLNDGTPDFFRLVKLPF